MIGKAVHSSKEQNTFFYIYKVQFISHR